MSTNIVPFAGKHVEAPTDQDQWVAAMIKAAGKAQKTGRGADGTIETMGELVPRARLWVDPRFPVVFSKEDIDTMYGAVIASGRQESAIHVVKVENPSKKAASHNGTTDQDLLIVDIDGALLFKATAGTTFDHYRVEIEEYDGGYSDLLLRMGNAKAQQYTMRRVDKGRLYLNAREAHETEAIWRHGNGMPKMPPFPAKAKIAAKFGCASESDLIACVAMCNAVTEDPDLAQLVDAGKLSDDNVREIASLPAPERLEVAQQLAEHHEETGAHAPREMVREVKAAARDTPAMPAGSSDRVKLVSDKPSRKPIPWQSVAVVFSARKLAIANADDPRAEMAAPVILGRLLHDVEATLDEMSDATPKEAMAFVKRVRDLLASTDAQELIQHSMPL